MNILSRFIEEKMAPPLIRFSRMKYVEIVQGTFLPFTPILIIGSLFLLLASLPFEPYKQLIGDFSTKFASLSGIATGIISLLVIISSSYSTINWYNTRKKEKNDVIGVIVLAVAAFIIFIPAQTVELLGSTSDKAINFTGIPTEFLGSKGVFVALLIGILTTEAQRFLVRKKLVIKMPDSVPPMVAQAFANLIPALIILTFWWVVKSVLNIDLPNIIMNIFTPLVSAGDSPALVMLSVFLNRILWTVGINGGTVVGSVAGPIWTQMNIVNQEAMIAGNALQYMFSGQFYEVYIWTGLAPLAIVMMTSKSPRLKALGALSLFPALFNIGEPLVFGIPIVLNPLLMIPFVLSYVVVALVAIIFTMIGFIPVPVLTVPWITPAPIKAFLSTNADLRAVIFVIVTWIVLAFIFYPFVKIIEKEDLKGTESEEPEVIEQGGV